MGQQHRRTVKRRRRLDYVKRKKELAQSASAVIPVRLASVTKKQEKPADDAKEKPAKKAPAKKAPAAKKEAAPKKAPAAKKEPAAKKAPAKKAPAKKKAADESAAE